MDQIIFHIDVNSAYLSWTAVKRLQDGEGLDIRTIPSVVGGSVESRHGIVLAKSIPAKKYHIETGEPLIKALQKCPNLKIYPPDYNLFSRCSDSMVELFNEYTPKIQRYSVDECFLDCSHFKDDYMKKAEEISFRIKSELGFTVNVGISTNKLLAKMASDLQKPDKIHTLFPWEIKEKMWPLKVEDLFMVGRATKPKLNKLNIETIGDLAKYDKNLLKVLLKSHGAMLHDYANGIEDSQVRKSNVLNIKGIGNSTTISYDMENVNEIKKVILSLVENSAMRLRKHESLCGLVTVHVKNTDFITYSHQKKMNNYTDSTDEIYRNLLIAFDELWRGEKIRQVGIRLSNLCSNEFYQSSLFDSDKIDKKRALDNTIDKLREKYGQKAVVRSTFINSGIAPIKGGVGEEEYPVMSSIL